MKATYPADPVMLNLGLLIARLVIGLLMAAHGTQKLFGWFGGYGLNTTGEFFVQLGFQRGRAFATLASVAEVASGLLVALGFLGPVGPAMMISVMLVAAISVHLKNGLFAAKNGLGLLVQQAYGLQQYPKMFAVVVLIALIAFCGNLVLWSLERRVQSRNT